MLFHPQDRERLLLWMRLASRQAPLWLPYRQTRLCLALLCRLDGGALLLAVHLEDKPGGSGAGMNLDGAWNRQAVEICGEDSHLNLLINAEQSILGAARQGRIRICTRRMPGSRLRLEIEDDGPGIPQEILPRIFDSFFTTKPAGTGTGLGLSIVHQIITQHEGNVFAESRLGGGARMVIVLPMVASSPAAPQAIIPETAKPEQVNTCQERPSIPSGAKILVVEDERIVAELIRDVLREDGYIVDMVRDGREGFSRLSQGPYDLAICDVRTPGLDGPSLCETFAATIPPPPCSDTVRHRRHRVQARRPLSGNIRTALAGQSVPGGRTESGSSGVPRPS
jgi:hypothetical protein